jgi:hypothetical protein
MSSSPSSSTGDTPQQSALSEAQSLIKHRADSKSRELTKAQFWQVLNEKWPLVREECSKHWNGPDAADCQFEKSVMREHIEVFEHGVVLSLIVFTTLRLTAHPKFTPFAENYIKPIFRLTPPKKKKPTQSHYDLKPNHQTKKTQAVDSKQPTIESRGQQDGRQFKSFLEKKRDAHVDRIHKAAEGPHDFMVASLVGLSATLFFLRPKQIRLDFEEAPLSPGRSFWSEHMCQDFIQIYQNTDPKVFDYDDREPDANMKSFQAFAENCIVRNDYIDKRKREGAEESLVLPTNGPWEEDEEEQDNQ